MKVNFVNRNTISTTYIIGVRKMQPFVDGERVRMVITFNTMFNAEQAIESLKAIEIEANSMDCNTMISVYFTKHVSIID